MRVDLLQVKGTEDAINTIIEAVKKAGYEMKKMLC